MYFHLVCLPEFFAVASGRKLFPQSLGLMVLKDHEFRRPHIPPLCLSFMPFSRGHITLHGEEGNRDVLGSLWVSQIQVVCVRKR